MLWITFRAYLELDVSDLCRSSLLKMGCQYREKRPMLEFPLDNG